MELVCDGGSSEQQQMKNEHRRQRKEIDDRATFLVRMTNESHMKYTHLTPEGNRTVDKMYVINHLNPDLLSLAVLTFFDSAAYFFRATFLILFLSCDFGLSDRDASMVYAWYGNCTIAYAIVIMMWCNDTDPIRLMSIGSILEATGTLLLLTTTSMHVVYFSMFCVIPIGTALGFPVTNKLMKRLMFMPALDKVNNIFNVIQNLGAMLALASVDGLRYWMHQTSIGISEYRMMFIFSMCLEMFMFISLQFGVIQRNVIVDRSGRLWKIIKNYNTNNLLRLLPWYRRAWIKTMDTLKRRKRVSAISVRSKAEMDKINLDRGVVVDSLFEPEYAVEAPQAHVSITSKAISDGMDGEEDDVIKRIYVQRDSKQRVVINLHELKQKCEQVKAALPVVSSAQIGKAYRTTVYHVPTEIQNVSSFDLMDAALANKPDEDSASLLDAFDVDTSQESRWKILKDTITNKSFAKLMLIGILLAIGPKTISRNLETVYPKVMQRYFEPGYNEENDATCMTQRLLHASDPQKVDTTATDDDDDEGTRDTVPWATFMTINPVLITLCTYHFNDYFVERMQYMHRFIVGSAIASISLLSMSIYMSYATVIIHIIVMSVGEMIWSSSLIALAQKLAPAKYIGVWTAVAMIPMMGAKFFSGWFSGILLDKFCPDSSNCHASELWAFSMAMSLVCPIGLFIGTLTGMLVFNDLDIDVDLTLSKQREPDRDKAQRIQKLIDSDERNDISAVELLETGHIDNTEDVGEMGTDDENVREDDVEKIELEAAERDMRNRIERQKSKALAFNNNDNTATFTKSVIGGEDLDKVFSKSLSTFTQEVVVDVISHAPYKDLPGAYDDEIGRESIYVETARRPIVPNDTYNEHNIVVIEKDVNNTQ